ncbi:MAG: four helix bundle protein [Planctomycetota bacterium]
MAERIRSHHDLSVWQLGMDLTEAVYAITEGFPKQETYGLTSQLRRAAASVPANIAEGNGRDSTKDYLRHLSIAVGSLCEVETFLQLAVRLRYADATKINPLLDMLNEEGRMLKGLQRSLRAKLSTT